MQVLLPWLTACDAGFQSALSTVEKGYKDNVSSLTAELEVARSASAQVEQLKMELQAARSEVAAITCARDRAVADGVTLSAELSALRSDVSRGRSIDATSPTSTANQVTNCIVQVCAWRSYLRFRSCRLNLTL